MRTGSDHPAAFEQLIALHEPRVRRLAHRLLGWRDSTGSDADDVVQNVFLVALTRLGSFRGDASLATWLTTVTLNQCRSLRRKHLLTLRWLRSKEASPPADKAMLTDETSAQVRAAVQSLRPRDREVIVLFYLEELPAAEIARHLNLSPGAVDVRLHRARQRLKEKLTGLFGD